MQNYLFDFDGTLADTAAVTVAAFNQAFQAMGQPEPDPNVVKDYMGVPIEVSFPEMMPTLTDAQLEEAYDYFRTAYKDYEHKTTLFDGIKEVLDTLHSEGKYLAIVSSKVTPSLKRLLDFLEIADDFKDVVGSDQVTHYKPAPDGINLLISRNQLQAAETVMIGDARYDLQMGKNAGVKTCGCTWGAYNVQSLKDEEPTYLLNSPKDLLTL